MTKNKDDIKSNGIVPEEVTIPEPNEGEKPSLDIEAIKAELKAEIDAKQTVDIEAIKAELRAEMKKEEDKIQTINVNTTKGIFKDSGKEISILQKEALGYANQIVKSERVPFVCRKDLIGLFPDGLMTSLQGISINLIFDGRTVNLPKQIIKFIEKKIAQKADIEANKRNKTLEVAQKNNIGNY